VPVIVDENGTTVDGHHRAEIADRLGVGYRTDVKTGPSDEERRALAFER
jgi:ParB-like chromosome segregation protein Spo0J